MMIQRGNNLQIRRQLLRYIWSIVTRLRLMGFNGEDWFAYDLEVHSNTYM